MKKFLFAMSLLALAGVVNAETTTENMYAGLSVGRSDANMDCTGTSACDNKATSYKATFGYKINENFSVEGVYHDLGSVNASFGSSANLSLKSTSLGVRGLLHFPMGDSASGFVSLGGHYGESKASAAIGSTSGAVTEHAFKPSVGLGFDYNLGEQVDLRAELESQNFEAVGNNSYTVRSVNVGLKVNF